MIKKIFSYNAWSPFSIKEVNNTFYVALLLLITFGIYTAYNVQQFADILFWDETLYMQKGLQLWQKVELDWGPFYNVWYKFLTIFTADKFELYYLNIQLLCIMLPVVVFIFLVVYRIDVIWSFLLSVFFLYSFINLPVWPKVSHFCLLIFLIAIITARFTASVFVKLILIIIATVLCSYVRPEFYLAFLLIILISSLHLFFYAKNYPLRQIIVYAGIIIIIYFVIQFIGNPLKSGKGSRMLITFGQHFALNYSQWNHIENKPFWIDWVFYLQDSFIGKPTNETVAIIMHHLSSNIITYIKSIGKIISSFFIPLFHKYITWHALIASIIAWLLVIKFSNITFSKQGLIQNIKKYKSLLVILFIWCIPTFISSLIAYPRAHYLLLQIPFWILIVAIFLQSFFSFSNKYFVFSLLSIALFFAKPNSDSLDHFDLLREEKSLCNYKTAKYLEANFKNQSIKVFDFEGNISSVLPPNFTMNSVDFFLTGATSVSKYVDSTKTDILYVTPSLLNSRFTQNDTLLKKWLAQPTQYGFHKISTGNFDAYLLCKDSIK